MIVFTCKGCAIVATEGKDDTVKLSPKALNLKKYDEDSKAFLEEKNKNTSKALKTLLLKRFNLTTCKWSTLVAKCEIIKDQKLESTLSTTITKKIA